MEENIWIFQQIASLLVQKYNPVAFVVVCFVMYKF